MVKVILFFVISLMLSLTLNVALISVLCSPIGIIPYGIECELDVDNKTITLLEKIVE